MTQKRRRSQRQTIELEELKNDPNSLLSWGLDDPTLRKLETYRLYQTGYAVADIAEAFGFAHGYLYEMWDKFKAEGTEALVDKRWGRLPVSGPAKRKRLCYRPKRSIPSEETVNWLRSSDWIGVRFTGC